MADVFVSYSRRDSDFVERVVTALEARGKDVWIDKEGIRDAEVFPAALRAAVERSDGFVFVITPDSVTSRYCEQEVDHAVELGKRIVPLLRRPVSDDEVPEGVRVRNWIPFEDGATFDEGIDRLVGALDTDLDWARSHTRWTIRALEWDAAGRDRSRLLRGSELAEAERWLGSAGGKEPEPTPLQTEYVLAGRAAASRRQRAFLGASLVVAAIALGLLVFALISRHDAQVARTVDKSRALAARSENEVSVNPELAVLVAREAVKTKATPDALFALRGAIDASQLRLRLADAGQQNCGLLGATGLAYVDGGKLLARGVCDGTLSLMNARTGRVVRRLKLGKSVPSLVALPGGATIAAAGGSSVRIVDAATGAPRATLPTPAEVGQLASAGDRIGAVSVDDHNTGWLTVWTGPQHRARTFLHAPAVARLGGFPPFQSLAFAGASIVVGAETSADVYDLASHKLLRRLSVGGIPYVLASDPRGARLAIGALPRTGGTGTVTVWDTRTWRRVETVARFPSVQVTSLAWSPDGRTLAIGAADGTSGSWSVATKEQLASFLGPTAGISALAFSPDGRQLASAGLDGTARVWRAGGPELRRIETNRQPASLAVARGRITLTEFPDTVLAYKASGAPAAPPIEPTAPGGPSPTTPFLSDDGRVAGVVSQSLRVSVWDLASRRVIRTLPGATQNFPWLGLNRDGSRMAVFAPPHVEKIVDVATGRSLALSKPPPRCFDVRTSPFSPDGRLLAVGTFCGGVAVWDARTGRRLLTFSVPGQVADVKLGPDDRRVAVGSWDGTVTVRDLRGERPDRVLTGFTRGVDSVAFSPDGSLFAAGSLDDTVRLWRTSDWRLLRVLHQPDIVGAVRFAPDGRTIVTTDSHGTVRIWDTCTACGNAKALLALARRSVTRGLTPAERATFLTGY